MFHLRTIINDIHKMSVKLFWSQFQEELNKKFEKAETEFEDKTLEQLQRAEKKVTIVVIRKEPYKTQLNERSENNKKQKKTKNEHRNLEQLEIKHQRT